MKLLIAIPSYGGTVTTGCNRSVLQLGAVLQQHKIVSRIITVDEVDVVTARNTLASQLLRDDAFSHLLFIDADMIFGSETVLRLLGAEKPLIGCTYPKREIDLAKLCALAKVHPAPIAIAKASSFAVQQHSWHSTEIRNGMCQVEGLGMGLCLIDRKVFEKLAPKVRRNGAVYGFFDQISQGDLLKSEDLSFCARWKTVGGEVWALVDQDIGHVGTFTYRAKLIDAFR